MNKLAALLLILLLPIIPVYADVQSIQPVMPSTGNIQIVPAGNDLYCRWVLFQNNSTHVIRIGDRSTSSNKGITLQPGYTFYIGPQPAPIGPTNTHLTAWYAAGTAGDTLDVSCENGS